MNPDPRQELPGALGSFSTDKGLGLCDSLRVLPTPRPGLAWRTGDRR